MGRRLAVAVDALDESDGLDIEYVVVARSVDEADLWWL